MPGPLPKPDNQRRRRNAPSIPTTDLPAGGRKGRAPKCPYPLASDGAAWWAWAWRTPQAAAWGAGDLYALARRAQLEDMLVAAEEASLSLLREMRELDDRFGLTPKAMAALRWRIVAEVEAVPDADEGPDIDRFAHLRAV